MKDKEIKLVIGALLHDVGKVIYRNGDGRNHSQSGYDFLKNDVHIDEKDILDAVHFHHGNLLKSAELEDSSNAYITYIADNIASAVDRRKVEGNEGGFEKFTPLQSVFNILNGNDQNKYYSQGTLIDSASINYPKDEKEEYDESFYVRIVNHLKDNLLAMEWTEDYLNSLLEILEANFSYIPSSTAKDELADVSLFDHIKMTAAISSCILQYLEENEQTDYKAILFKEAKAFYEKKAFLLYSMDVSGIQDFIYTIHSKGALKSLRARSFYLEILMEHIIDELLQQLNLSRANLIYSGGGHCYILLANTTFSKRQVEENEKNINEWLRQHFGISLYIAGGWCECSSNDLKNQPSGSYADIFKSTSERISEKKSHRYSAAQIMEFNKIEYADFTRECRVCKKIDSLNEEDKCSMCASIDEFSKDILYKDFYSVILEERKQSLPLPGNMYLIADDEKSLTKRIKEDQYFVRSYVKNNMYSGKHIATKLWVGDYTTGETFEELAKKSKGIERIGVLRADVDSLGKAFVSGFESPKTQDKYVALSRTATLSRQLSLFFKYHINAILEKGEYAISGIAGKRNIVIVYSGGDDLFVVGAWNEVLEFSIDLRNALLKYTQNTLTISAGIGIYPTGYPISAIAKEVEKLEDASKQRDGKDAITFLPDGEKHIETTKDNILEIDDGTYPWAVFIDSVLGEKFETIYQFFENSEDRGKNFLYNILELIRGQKERINLARFVYLLARLEPEARAGDEQMRLYREFSRKMYQWIRSEKDCRELKTAINLYAYYKREKGEK